MASAQRTLFRAVLVVLVAALIAGGALCFASYRAVTTKANAEYGEFAPVSARLSRLRAGQGHGFSILWKLSFAKQSKQTPSIAVWRAQPFGSVNFEGSRR
jgi:hypothetical protein